jgi:hypothetical protein
MHIGRSLLICTVLATALATPHPVLTRQQLFPLDGWGPDTRRPVAATAAVDRANIDSFSSSSSSSSASSPLAKSPLSLAATDGRSGAVNRPRHLAAWRRHVSWKLRTRPWRLPWDVLVALATGLSAHIIVYSFAASAGWLALGAGVVVALYFGHWSFWADEPAERRGARRADSGDGGAADYRSGGGGGEEGAESSVRDRVLGFARAHGITMREMSTAEKDALLLRAMRAGAQRVDMAPMLG